MAEENDKKKGKIFDKVVMGAIIGGAIGSVIGATVGGKKQEDTKNEAVEEPRKAKASSKTILKRLVGIFTRKRKEEEAKKIPTEVEE